jgi:hypothetical protein
MANMAKIREICSRKHEDTPPALEMKEIILVKREGAGYLAMFSCKHIVWCAVDVKEGQKMYCSVCVYELVQQLRDTQVSGLGRTGCAHQRALAQSN